MKKLRIITSVLLEILRTLVSLKAEQGGVLLGYRTDYVVRQFIHDKHASTTQATYELNVEYLNPKIKKAYEEHGYELLGIWHTHPPGFSRLSTQDREYLQRQVQRLGLDEFLAPICFSAKDTTCEIHPFIMLGDGSIEQADLEVVPNDFEVIQPMIEPGLEDINGVENQITSKELPTWKTHLNRLLMTDGYRLVELVALWGLVVFFFTLLPTLHRFLAQLLKV